MEQMDNHGWVVVGEVAGPLQGEILRGLLEAQGIAVQLEQESAGRAYGLTLGPLGTVRILVHAAQRASAEEVLDEYEFGQFESGGDNGEMDLSGEDLI